MDNITTKKCLAVLTVAVLLAACDPGETFHQPKPDQKLRREIFMECLQKAPAGPQSTRYNDWAEVVDECQSAAYYQSLVLE